MAPVPTPNAAGHVVPQGERDHQEAGGVETESLLSSVAILSVCVCVVDQYRLEENSLRQGFYRLKQNKKKQKTKSPKVS